MKNALTALFIGLMMMAPVWTSSAQVVLPNENPRAVFTQEIGLNLMSIEYTRPDTRGHVIFGERVPFGERWLNNDRHYVRMTFNDKMILENGEILPAGTYAVEAIPNENQWTIIFLKGQYKQSAVVFMQDNMNYLLEEETETWFSKDREVARLNVVPEKMKEQVENFTVMPDNVCSNCAEIQLMWDYTRVSFGISTEADEAVLDEIEKFTNHPEQKLAGQYYLAAKYYLDTNRELDKALEWVNLSLKYSPEAYWVMHTKAEILAKMGEHKQAIDVAEESIKLAKEKNDLDFVRINEQEIKRWKEQRKM